MRFDYLYLSMHKSTANVISSHKIKISMKLGIKEADLHPGL